MGNWAIELYLATGVPYAIAMFLAGIGAVMSEDVPEVGLLLVIGAGVILMRTL